MAGGKGSRMGGPVEKPLLEISGESMLEHVVKVLKSCQSIERVVIASTRNTPTTSMKAEKFGVESVITPGEGFESDMRFAIHNLSLRDVLVISADLPFLTVGVIEDAARKYRKAGKPALAVMAPVELYDTLGLKPTYVFETNGRELVPVGINILDGKRIDEGTLDEAQLIVESGDLTFNVNTPGELAAARKRVAKGKR